MLACLIFKDLLLERAVGMSEVCVELVGKLVGEMLGLSKEELSPSDNLISLGLGSLDIMRIAGLLTKNGCNVTFSELVSNPCMASWVNFARERSARSSSNGSPLLGSANYSKGDPFPITSVQHAYMVGRRDGQELGGTACHAYMEFECGSLDAAKLERAVELLILRHPMLRARFSDDGTARIEDKVTWKGLTTYRVEGAGNPDSRIEGIRQELSHLRFDIEQDDLIDVRLTVVSPKRTIMHINVDLLAADVLSIQVLLEDLAHLYDGTDLAPIEIDFMEYARRTGIGEDARNEDREYWLNRIDNMPGGPSLPLKAPMESVKRSQFTRMEYLIDSKSWKNFTEKGRQIGVTQSMGIAAVYAKALSRWSEDKKFLLNLPLFNRKPIHPDVDKIVSDFTSLILLEADCANAISLLELASQMQGRFQQDVAHSSFGAVEVLRELSHRCPNDPKKAPVVFASNIGTQFISNKVEDVFGPLSKMLAETPQVLLDHQIYDHKNGLLLAWDYVSELLDDKIAKQMFEAYCTAVRFYCENDWSEPFPDLLPPSQRAARAEANSEGADLGGGTLHGRFFARAQAEPDAPALRWGADGEATYGELAGRALRIAGGLAAAGVGEGDRVAVRLPKGPGQVAAVLGVLAAGAAYVPVGVSQPEARAALILEQAGASLCVDSTELARLEAADPLPAPAGPSERALAYVIYTSGSTGVPKGVAVSHAAAWNTIADVVRRWGMGPGDAVLGVSALDFDLSVFDIFGALSFGAAVVLPDEEERRDASAWRELVSSRGVTVWNSAPALLDVMLDDGPGAAAGLRLALVSGDWVPLGLRSKLPEGVLLVAMGGATEAGIWSNYFEVGEVDPSWSSIPYGRPLSNQSFRVVGEDGLDCPDWVPGELWIGGGSLADGYLGDPGKTAASFVEDGGRWYRTGDMGRYWPGAVLEFLGRKDSQQQVKIRGHRVELGEVEAAVAGCPGVKGAVAVVAGEREHLFAVAIPAISEAPIASISERSPVENREAEHTRLTALSNILIKERGLSNDRLFTNEQSDESSSRYHAVMEMLSRNTSNCSTVCRDNTLEEAADFYEKILTEAADPSTLYESDRFSPEALFLSRNSSQRIIKDAIATIKAMAETLGRKLKVADFGCRSGRISALLLPEVADTISEYHLLDTSQSMLDMAKTRLDDFSEKVRTAKLTKVVDQDIHARFDVVVSINAIHTMEEPSEAISALGETLAADGRAFIVDPTEFAPSAMVTAAIAQCAFGDGEPSGLLSPEKWIDSLSEKGLRADWVKIDDGLFISLSSRTSPPIDLTLLRSTLEKEVPAYMVPEHLGILPSQPLSRNGKVDKGSVKDWAELYCSFCDASDNYIEPNGEIEKKVSSIWSKFLGGRRVGRYDGFFEYGGDSLSATRMISALSKIGIKASLKELFASGNLADFCKGLSISSPNNSKAITINEELRFEPFDLTEVQRAYTIGRTSGLDLGKVGSYCFFMFETSEYSHDRFASAWRILLERHGALRTLLVKNGEKQQVYRSSDLNLPLAVQNAMDSKDARKIVEQAMSHRSIDLTKSPGFEALSAVYSSGAVVGIGFDNTMVDGVSMSTVLAELAELYENPGADLPGIGLTFRDFVVGHRRDGREVEEAEGYWRSRLPELPPAPQLPLAADPSTVGEGRFERLWRTVAEPEWSAVKEKARLHGITPSAVLLACYARVLSAWSGGGGVTLNLTIFDRPEVHPDIDKVVGDFTTLLPVACRPSADASVEAQMRGVQNELAGGLEHRAVSAVWVQRELARSAGTSGVVLPVVFTSALGLSRFDLDGGFMDYLGGLSQTPQVWLDHQAMERGGGVMLSWDYVSELFPDGMIADMFDAYCSAVSSLAASDWSEPFPDLLPPSQRAARAEANSEGADLGGGTLHGRFFARAQAEPDAPALRWGADGEATYGELAGRALRIAGGLAAAGVGEGDRVAVRLPKGPGQVAAVLGVLAAGAAYVPVGVSQPEARAALILEQAGASLCVDSTELARLEAADPLPAPAGPSERALAYVIYTSGSTGVPKGVAVSHAAAWNTIADVVRRWGMGPGDAVLGVSALDFDLSVFDIFGALSFGAAVVLPDEEERRDASAWRELVSSRGVTVWNSAPALLDVMLDDGPGAAAGLRLALVSGDWVPLGLRSKLPEGVLLVAMGGATEAGIWSNYFEVGEVDPSWSSIPYGRPLSNQSFRVVGEDGLDCPDWVPGELWIGGGSLADGYLGDPGKTAASFVEDGGRWYRTGDMGRYWPGAVLEFLGRKDSQQQVKIRGHRVELGEVEAAVAGCPGVKGAVAVVAGERERSVVHAFVVADEGADVDPAGVLSRVAGLLPSYFVPHDVTVLDEWPLSANGKVDRKALAGMAPEAAPSASSLSEPATEAERAVASVWEELLDAGPVGRESNFFELGGDSLMAMRMTSALEKRLGFKIGLQEFISDPTVAGICQKIDTTCGDTYEEGTL